MTDLNKIYKDVKKFVTDEFNGDIAHLERTAYWVKYFGDEEDVLMQIAAFSHDIERANRGEYMLKLKKEKGVLDKEFLRIHQNVGAEIMRLFLEKYELEEEYIDYVCDLIKFHEVGGDEKQNLLKDCDSLSFFETNVERFVEDAKSGGDIDKITKKINYMYDRIDSQEIKEKSKAFYDKITLELSKI